MRTSLLFGAAGAIVLLTSYAGVASAQSQEAAIVESATNVLTEFMSMPNEGIPRAMLANAQGLVIVPAMVKVGLVAEDRGGTVLVTAGSEEKIAVFRRKDEAHRDALFRRGYR